MLALKGRQNGFRLILPKEFLCPEIEEKYTKILRMKHSYFYKPIDFLNETIQKVQILGFNNATIQQQQSVQGDKPLIDSRRQRQNEFMYPSTDYNYRSETSPLSLVDRTLNVEFRHTNGYLNYFMLFENFWYQYARDRKYSELCKQFNIDLLDDKGSIYSRVVLFDPLVNGMDMLDFDYTQPIAQAGTFKVEYKYSNFDYQFIEIEDNEKPDDYYINNTMPYYGDINGDINGD